METHHLQKLDSYLQEFDQMQKSADQREMAIAISHLKNEFCYILSGYSSPSIIDDDFTDSSCSSSPVHLRFSVSSDISEPDEVEMDDSRIHCLRCIAERVISAGFAQDCVESYSRIRRQAMCGKLMEMEIEVRNTGHVQILEQEMQARRIKQWIRAAREFVKIIFAKEKLMIHQIFNGLANDEDMEEICFALTVKSSALQLLDCAGEISAVPAQSAPERLFPVLDLYEVLSELLPAIKTMFGGKYVYLGAIYKQAEHLLIKLADAAKGILSEFENSLLNETVCKGTQAGDVLPLTRYVMDFLKKMAVYRQPLSRMADCLNELIVSKPSGKNPRTPEMDPTEFEEETPLGLHLIWIILILQSNLETKSKHYRNVSLSHFFMLNNVYFIVREITNSPELTETLEGSYKKILTAKYRHSAMTYLRSSWAKVLHCLRQDQSLYVSISGNNKSLRVSKSALRERFKTFNTMFEEVHRIQATWFVPCTILRLDLWISISEKLIPAYRTIMGRFRDTIERDGHMENYVKYTEADLENAVLDLFKGHSVSQPLRRRVDADSIASGSMETRRLQDLDVYLQRFDQMQESADQTEMSIDISRLKDEFCYLLTPFSVVDESCYYTDSSCSSTPVHFRFSTSSNISELDCGDLQMDDSRIHYLRCVSKRLIAAGFAQDCVDYYSRFRRQAMDARLMDLEIEVRNTGHVQILEQEMQVRKIRRWIRAAREFVETIFAKEKLIIHHIFNGLASDEDEERCFSLTVKSSALQLLNFAEGISRVPAQSAPERLFPVLDLYEVLSELLPSIETIFGGMLLGSIHEQAERLQLKLADVAKRILTEFEKSLLNETGRKVKQTGDVLPLAKYAMDFLKMMAVYRQPLTRLADFLNDLIVSKPSGNPGAPEMDLTEFEGQTPLALHLNWITVILQFKLEAESKECKDVSLSHLFMMNNVYFIVQEVTGLTELREVMGDDYVKMMTGKFRLAATIYLRSTWAKVLNCCRDQGLLSKHGIRERIKTFNATFAEVHRTQAMWLVPDTQLREELWISISVKLIPAYRSMIRRFRFSNTKTIESGCVKYTLTDLENAVLDLFEGRPVSQSSRRRVDANSI